MLCLTPLTVNAASPFPKNDAVTAWVTPFTITRPENNPVDERVPLSQATVPFPVAVPVSGSRIPWKELPLPAGPSNTPTASNAALTTVSCAGMTKVATLPA